MNGISIMATTAKTIVMATRITIHLISNPAKPFVVGFIIFSCFPFSCNKDNTV